MLPLCQAKMIFERISDEWGFYSDGDEENDGEKQWFFNGMLKGVVSKKGVDHQS